MKGGTDADKLVDGFGGRYCRSFYIDIYCYVPHFSPTLPQQTLLRRHINSRAPKHSSYCEKSVAGNKMMHKKQVSF